MYEAYNTKMFNKAGSVDTKLQDFKEFKPAEDKSLNFGSDFTINPKKFYCLIHKQQEVEFCCEITEEFYCRKCAPNHSSHRGDRVLNGICLGLQ